jgi:hypothetical protein
MTSMCCKSTSNARQVEILWFQFQTWLNPFVFPQKNKFDIFWSTTECQNQGCQLVKASDWPTRPSVRPSCPSDKAYGHPLRNIRAYSSIFKHILENFQRICQLHPITNGHVHPSVSPSHPYMMSLSPCLSFMTTLVKTA